MNFDRIETPFALEEVSFVVGTSWLQTNRDAQSGRLPKSFNPFGRMDPKFRFSCFWDILTYLFDLRLYPAELEQRHRFAMRHELIEYFSDICDASDCDRIRLTQSEINELSFILAAQHRSILGLIDNNDCKPPIDVAAAPMVAQTLWLDVHEKLTEILQVGASYSLAGPSRSAQTNKN